MAGSRGKLWGNRSSWDRPAVSNNSVRFRARTSLDETRPADRIVGPGSVARHIKRLAEAREVLSWAPSTPFPKVRPLSTSGGRQRGRLMASAPAVGLYGLPSRSRKPVRSPSRRARRGPVLRYRDRRTGIGARLPGAKFCASQKYARFAALSPERPRARRALVAGQSLMRPSKTAACLPPVAIHRAQSPRRLRGAPRPSP